MKRILGYTILILFFGSFYVAFGLLEGFLETTLIFLVAVLVSAIVIYATKLINQQ